MILSETDTIICFTIPQSKFLLKQSIELEYCNTREGFLKSELLIKDSLIISKDFQINGWEEYKSLSDSVNAINNTKLDVLTAQLNASNKKYLKEKRAKITALILGIVATSVTTTLYIIK